MSDLTEEENRLLEGLLLKKKMAEELAEKGRLYVLPGTMGMSTDDPVVLRLRQAYEAAQKGEYSEVFIVALLKGHANDAQALWAGGGSFALEGAIRKAARRLFGS